MFFYYLKVNSFIAIYTKYLNDFDYLCEDVDHKDFYNLEKQFREIFYIFVENKMQDIDKIYPESKRKIV